MAQLPVPVGEIFANKYRVERILGEGGMGVVVAAHHLELDQPVAVKFLLDNVAEQEEGAERFRREARAAAKIHSDHVVRVLDVGVMDNGIRYMVMEYLEGRDLSEELAEHKRFSVGAAAGFILEAIDAVGQAHAVGIVHRDLKPANLFLAHRPDGSRRIKVLDFGISKSVGSGSEQLSLTKTSAWIGSPLYMAPEQMQSARDVDIRADIWSLGAILYELVSGEPPYLADSLPQLCTLLLTREPMPIQEKCPELPDGLAKVIMGCLVRDREARIQSTTELARGLVQYATTITGSSMRSSLLDLTEFQSNSLPASMLASMPAAVHGMSRSSASVTGGAAPGAATELSGSAIDGRTHAAWGATDAGERRSGSKVILLIAALAIAGVGGFFLASRGGNTEPETMVADSPVAPVEASQNADFGVSDGKPKDGEKSGNAGESKAGVVEQLAKPEPATPHVDAQEKLSGPAPSTASTSSPTVVPPTSSQPVVGPRPVSRPTAPASVPSPVPATKDPAPQDDFADFGGRR